MQNHGMKWIGGFCCCCSLAGGVGWTKHFLHAVARRVQDKSRAIDFLTIISIAMDSQDGVGWGLPDVRGMENFRSVADASFFPQRHLHNFFRFDDSPLFLQFLYPAVSLRTDTGPFSHPAMAGLAVHNLGSAALRFSSTTILSYSLQSS